MKPLLTANWDNLVVLNYEIDPVALIPYLPAYTQPDLWNNKCYISLVAFKFRNPHLLGIPIPFYKKFEQVNLRFYVKHVCKGEIRKGVVFIKEIAAGRLLKAGAALLYNEQYTNLPTRHSAQQQNSLLNVKYEWSLNKKWNYIHAVAETYRQIPDSDSLEAFIANRFWGYTKIDAKNTAVFKVEHEPWQIQKLESCYTDFDSSALYGPTLHTFLSKKPVLSFMIDGSFVKMYGKKQCNN